MQEGPVPRRLAEAVEPLPGLSETPFAPPLAQRAAKLGDAAYQHASAGKDLAVYRVEIRIGRDEPETAGHANCDPDHASFCFDHETVHECTSSMRARSRPMGHRKRRFCSGSRHDRRREGGPRSGA